MGARRVQRTDRPWLQRLHAEIVDASILWHEVFEQLERLS